ncbi:MAG: G8 domain-containing protein, partial [Bacteroidota bacterium]|nr:G8 domain-containing protein [Bacteroidota bacterium]
MNNTEKNITPSYIRIPFSGLPFRNIFVSIISVFVLGFFGGVKAAPITSTAAGGNWSATTSWVGGIIPAATDDVTIANAAIVTIDVSTTVNSLTIGQGISGTLQYDKNSVHTVTVNNNIIIKTGGIFQSATSGAGTINFLNIGGSFTNSGTLNFSTNGNNSGVLITFTGSSNADFDCSGNTSTNLRQLDGGSAGVTLNKGSSNSTFLNFIPGPNTTFTILGSTTTGFLSISNGTFKIIGSNTFSNSVFNFASYDIPSTAGIWLNNPNATIVGQNGTVTLRSGFFRITSGTYNIGTSSGNSLIYSAPSIAPVLTVEGGNFNVTGRISPLTAGASIVNYSQSNGTVTVVTQGSASASFAGFDIGATGSSFTMNGGSIVVQNATSNASDYLNLASTNNVTGGTIQIGNSSTTISQTFRVNTNVPIYDFKIYNNNAASQLVTNNLTLTDQLILNGGNIDAATNSKTVIVSNNATTAISRTLGYVIGNLQRAIASSGSLTYTYPIGTSAGNYTPVDLQFNNLTTSGNITAYATSGDHSSIASSSLDATKSVNNYWTFTNSGVAFTNYGATFSYPSTLLDVGATPASFLVGKFDSPNWTYPTINGTPTNTSTSITAITSLSASGSSFAIANCATPTITLSSSSVSVCRGTTSANLPYTNTTANPITYSISWNASAISAGFVNVTNGTLPLSPIVITVPGAASAGTYLGTLTVTNGGGCVSAGTAISVIINPLPTLSGASQAAAICSGSSATINLTGLLASSTSTINYSINGVAQTPV